MNIKYPISGQVWTLRDMVELLKELETQLDSAVARIEELERLVTPLQ